MYVYRIKLSRQTWNLFIVTRISVNSWISIKYNYISSSTFYSVFVIYYIFIKLTDYKWSQSLRRQVWNGNGGDTKSEDDGKKKFTSSKD